MPASLPDEQCPSIESPGSGLDGKGGNQEDTSKGQTQMALPTNSHTKANPGFHPGCHESPSAYFLAGQYKSHLRSNTFLKYHHLQCIYWDDKF